MSGARAESTVTQNSTPTIGSGIGSIATGTAGQFVPIDVTSVFQNRIASPSSNQGFALTGVGSTDASLDSKESVTTSHPAMLQLVQPGATGPQGLGAIAIGLGGVSIFHP